MIRLEESMGSLLISSVGSIDIPGRPFVSGAKYEASRVPSGDISKDIDLRRMALGTRGTVPDVGSKQPGHRAKSAALPLLVGRPLSQAHGSNYGSATILYRPEPGWIARKDSAVMDVPQLLRYLAAVFGLASGVLALLKILTVEGGTGHRRLTRVGWVFCASLVLSAVNGIASVYVEGVKSREGERKQSIGNISPLRRRSSRGWSSGPLT